MIIVVLDEQNKLTDFFNVKTIQIYKKKQDGFKIVKTISDLQCNTSNMNEFKAFLERLKESFGASNIIIGSQITGVAFHYFVKLGFEICEADELSEELLEQIYIDLIEQKKMTKAEYEQEKLEIEQTPIKPVAIDEEGNYYLDFIKIQKYRPEISSKKAMLPLLSSGEFQSLTVICSHIMPWIENFLRQSEGNFNYNAIREDGRYTITISKK